jgi:hypothetical protein
MRQTPTLLWRACSPPSPVQATIAFEGLGGRGENGGVSSRATLTQHISVRECSGAHLHALAAAGEAPQSAVERCVVHAHLAEPAPAPLAPGAVRGGAERGRVRDTERGRERRHRERESERHREREREDTERGRVRDTERGRERRHRERESVRHRERESDRHREREREKTQREGE